MSAGANQQPEAKTKSVAKGPVNTLTTLGQITRKLDAHSEAERAEILAFVQTRYNACSARAVG